MTDRELSRRQREIMDALAVLGQGSVADILGKLSDSPSYNSVRKILSILESQGHVVHEQVGRQFVYRPKREPAQLGSQALHKVLKLFFGGSLERAVASYFSDPDTHLTQAQLAELQSLLAQAQQKSKESAP
jgi:predicted transcriptional regulator